MIKLTDLTRLESIKNAQLNVKKYGNYLTDVLKPAIELGDWDEFESLDIGFTVEGSSLGKIGDNEAWKKLQSFFEPNNKTTITLDFTIDGFIIERNLKNQLKALALKMMWISPREHSFQTIYGTIVTLKKAIQALLKDGCNSFEMLDFDRLESWVIRGTDHLDFETNSIYAGLNKLYTESKGLPFKVSLNKNLSASDFGLVLKDPKQFNVIPQRLYYLGLQKSEELINEIYPLRDELFKLTDYITTYYDKLYSGYANWLLNEKSKPIRKGKTVWHISESKQAKTKSLSFKKAFLALADPTEDKVIELLKVHKPELKTKYHIEYTSSLNFTFNGKKVNNLSGALTLFKELSGGCIWGLMSRTGMRADELYNLHTTNGYTVEIISNQEIYIIHADLSKTTKGIQSKQDEFITTEVGKKAYELLQALHEPLRDLHPGSKNFFHKVTQGFGPITKHKLARHPQDWFHKVMGKELLIKNEDVVDLKVSDPNRIFNIGDEYEFSGHQLRRSFSYYLIGYELLSFPQLKQQFSHVSMAMTRHYARNASKFQKLRKKNKNLVSEIEEERIEQKAMVYLNIYKKLANKERVAGGKGKTFAKNMMKSEQNLFKDKIQNDMLSLSYWKKQIRNKKRHIHAVAPGIYCTSSACSLRTKVNLLNCVDCTEDFIVDAVFAEAKRKEAEFNMLWDIEHDELNAKTATEAYIKITAAERIMQDLGIEYEPVTLPKQAQELLIPFIGETT